MTEPTTGAVPFAEPTPPDLLEAQQRVLEMMVQNVPLADALGSLCRIVEEQAPAPARAAILLVTPDGRHLTTGAAPSLPESYCRAIDGVAISAFVGTCSAAAARRHVITTPDIANDPAWHRFKHLPLGLGLKAAWSMPILSAAGSVLGTFGTYFAEEREPVPAERKLVEVLSRTAALAIERQRSDEALKRSEARHRAMVEASPECVKIVAADGTLLQINPAGLRMFEAADESEVTGLSVYDGLVPEDRERYRAFNDRVCGGESASLRFSIITRNGKRRTMESNAVPMPTAEGGFAQLSVTRDVTEQRELDAAVAADLKDTRLLRELAARLISDEDAPALFDEILAAAMAITEADAGTIQLLDRPSHTLTFLARRGFVPDITVHFEGVNATPLSPCGLALARGERAFVVFDNPGSSDTDDSNKLHLEAGMCCAQSTPLVSRSGKPLGMFSTHWREYRRLTERELRFLDLLARQAADLIERIQAQEALRASEKQLREADRRKDEFIAVLAHELRNPLVPIRTGVELLKSARERPVLIDAIRPMMERQVGHMVRLIDDLLDVSRITSGKIELRRQRVTLSSVVGSAIEANRAAIAGGGLELSTNLDDPHRIIEVDPTRFSQVISNLVQNAAKFTAAGGKVTISAAVESDASAAAVPELVLNVADTGIGIEAHQLPRVFDLFAQAHPGGYDRHAGLGIGLALARSLVQLHGGSISASSGGIGQGSLFTVRVPAPSLAPADLAGAHASRSLGGLRVLVVDDNRDAADAMMLLVSQLGGDVRVAYDGLSALAVLDEFQAAVVLLDIGMPGLDGYQTCRQIRERQGAAVCVVAVTGWGQEQDRQLAAQAGFDAHMTKPADPEQLVELLGARARINQSGMAGGNDATADTLRAT
jgi:PAS domain S-box-containing protein